jgi:hypothetical protein
MSLRVFLLCAGEGSRWGEHKGCLKQLLRFGGETLLHRAIRLLRTAGAVDLILVYQDHRLAKECVGLKAICISKTSSIADSIHQTQAHWGSGAVAFVLPDVFFSPSAIRLLVRPHRSLVFIGRPWPSYVSRCGHGELFGLNVPLNSRRELLEVIDENLRKEQERSCVNLWNLLQKMEGLPEGSRVHKSLRLSIVDDYTNDIDTPIDYERRAKLYEQIASIQLRPRIHGLSDLVLRYLTQGAFRAGLLTPFSAQ